MQKPELLSEQIFTKLYAQSRKDFVSKLEIALKETNEASYWLKLLYETARIDDYTYKKLINLCGTIRRLLIASCRTSMERMN